MDDLDKPPILAESSITSEPVNFENDLISVPALPNDNLDIPLQETNSENISTSDFENEEFNQQFINKAEDQTTNMVIDSVAKISSHEMFLDMNAEKDQNPDTELETNDSLNDYSLNDSVSETDQLARPDQKTEKISQFPLGRVRDIMKADPDIKIVSADCVFLVAKATEMFLQLLGKEIHTVTLRNKKKTLQKRDLEAAVSENAAFEFLEGALN